jgi:cytochrome c
LGSGARSAMAGPVYHFDSSSTSTRKFPQEYDGALFIYEWERSWLGEVRLDSEGRFQKLQTFAPEITVKRPISMAFGPDGGLYVIQWGSAWYNNKDSELIRIEYHAD